MDIRQYLADVGQQMGLGKLELNADNVCELIFDGQHTLHIEATADTDTLVLSAPVASLTQEGSKDVYRAFMEQNFDYRTLSGATTAIDATTDEILLIRHVGIAQTPVDAFLKTMEAFVNQLDQTKEIVDRYAEAGIEPGANLQQFDSNEFTIIRA